MTEIAPCAGQWELFDSTDFYDHRRAKQICATCPMIARCEEIRASAEAEAHRGGTARSFGPRGTWAGQLWGHQTQNPERMAAEEDMFTDDEARAAHAKWVRTPKHLRADLTDRIRVGERVYQRRWKRGWRDAPVRVRGDAA